MACISVVMLLTVSDYGLTYDEAPHIRFGERVLDFYVGGFQRSPWLEKSPYGAGFDLVAAILRRVSPWNEFQTNHILCVFIAQVGLLGVWRLGSLVAGPGGGLLSLGFLILTPVYYSHQFNNPKDIPFAAGYVWGLYFVARLILLAQQLTLPSRRFWVGLSLSLTFALSVRIGGVLLIAFAGFFLACVALDVWRSRGAAALRSVAGVAGRALVSVLAGWALMVAFWPRALLRPLSGPANALSHVTNFTTYDSPTLLAGKVISSNDLSWDYLPTYFAYQLPELMTVLIAGAIVGWVVVSLRALRAGTPLPWMGWLLVAASLSPPTYAVLKGSTLYNGLRHFLFLIPPLAVMAAAAAVFVVRVLWQRKPWLGRVSVLLLCVFAADQLHVLWRLHPYQHVFFNRFSGGLRAAIGQYETEYYGGVYQELGEALAADVWRERRQEYLNTTYGVTGCGSKLFFTRNLPLNFQYYSMGRASRADYYATYVRDRCFRHFKRKPQVLSIKRDGGTLAVVRQLRSARGSKGGKKR